MQGRDKKERKKKRKKTGLAAFSFSIGRPYLDRPIQREKETDQRESPESDSSPFYYSCVPSPRLYSVFVLVPSVDSF